MRFCIAESGIAYRKFGWCRKPLLAMAMAMAAGAASTQAAELKPEVVDAIRRAAEAASAPAPRYPVLPAAPFAGSAAAPAASPSAVPAPAARPAERPASNLLPAPPPRSPPASVPPTRIQGRLQVADIGLVINTADPYSVAVGEHYIRRRGLSRNQVLRLALPTASTLTLEEFEHLRGRIDLRFGRKTQAVVLAWAQPYAVGCNSIGGALALGYDAALCENSCKPSRPSKYFNAATARPYADLGMRLSMHLAAPSIEAARELIDRGALADGSLALRDRQPVSVMLLTSNDAARAVRTQLYPPAGPLPGLGVNVRVEPSLVLPAARRVLMVSTGAVRLDFPSPLDWVPGGLGDHLTSYGGAIDPWHGQSTVMEWIASGATASHGTVSEPCNHLQKFPHPQVLLLHYLQGATALEAYWKSVAWPQQAMFVGEPLAAPFAVPAWAQAAAEAAAASAAAASGQPPVAVPVAAPPAPAVPPATNGPASPLPPSSAPAPG